jgi:hypothetical protein
MKAYLFKVALMHNKRIYRNIEILEDQTLFDLHEIIFDAFDRYDEHLYSFFLTRRSAKSTRAIYDSPEYTHPMALQQDYGFGFKKQYNAAESTIGKLGLKAKEKLYYLFDFGDEWLHELTVLKIQSAAESEKYPKIVKKAGESPDQYPDYEEEDEF